MYKWANTTLDLKYISYYKNCSKKHLKVTAQETFSAHVLRTLKVMFTVALCMSEKLESKCPSIGDWRKKHSILTQWTLYRG